LDWDHQQLHVVEAVAGIGEMRIRRAVVWEEPWTTNPAEAEKQGRLLKQRLQEAGISPAPVLACLGRDRVIFKDIRHPPVPETEEAAVVRFQATKELTEPPDQVVIDYLPNVGSGAGPERRALAAIVRREWLTQYQEICKAANLKLLGLTPRPFGLAAALRASAGSPAHPVAVLTLAQQWAEMAVVQGDHLIFSRSLAIGDSLAAEVRRNLAVCAGQAHQPVQTIYLAGAEEHAALRQRLEELPDVTVVPFDPFGGRTGLELPTSDRGGFLGAVGLLHARAKGLPLNFVHPRQVQEQRDPFKRRLIWAAALGAAVLLGVFGFGRYRLSLVAREVEVQTHANEDLDRDLTILEEDAKRIKALSDWNETAVVWLDELYDLTDRLGDPNALRLTQLNADAPLRTGKEKDKHAAKMTLRGVLKDDPKLVDRLSERMTEDGHYRVDPRSVVANDGSDKSTFPLQFTIPRVDVDKVEPSGYTRRLPVPQDR
jgi:hypothetical protein